MEFTGIALDSHSVQLSWRLPIEQNGLINGFEIFYAKNDMQNLSIEEWNSSNVDGTQFAHIIKNLNSSTEYKFVLKARNSAGLSKASPKLIISTLKENYDKYETFLTDTRTPEPDLTDANTYRYTKYEDMSYRDIFSLNESSEILIRIGIGVGCLVLVVAMMSIVYFRICSPVPVRKCKCGKHPNGSCLQINDFSKGVKRRRNESYLPSPYSVTVSNSNQSVLQYSRQNSVNLVDNNSYTRHSSISSGNIQQQQLGTTKNVQAEVHQTNSLRQQKDDKQKSLDNLNNQKIAKKDDIILLNNGNFNGLQSTSSEENSLNDQNLNCQLQLNRNKKLNNGSITQLTNGHLETEFNGNFISDNKRTFKRDYKKEDKEYKELNRPLITEYDQPINIIPNHLFDQPKNCQNHNLILENGFSSNGQTNNRNSLSLKSGCNCHQNSNRNNCNNIDNEDEISLNNEIVNERRSLV